MPTKQERSSSIALRAVRPNAGVRSAYAKKLRALIDAMSKDMADAVMSVYRKDEPLIAQDAKLPAKKLSDVMAGVRKRWEKRFDEDSDQISTWFAKTVKSSVTRQKRSAVKDSKIPSAFAVNFDKGRVSQDVFEAIVAQNASLIKSIADKYLSDVEGLVMRSVTDGRDIKGLSQELQQRYNLTKRRADFIARDQNNKATESLARAQDTQAGITRGVWMHIGGKYTSFLLYKKMDGEEFDLAEGLYDKDVDRKVMPGELPGCQCTYRPLFPKDIWKK